MNGSQAAPSFPTQKEFETWWKGKRDPRNAMGFRAQRCPLARYLRTHGFPDAEVYINTWRRDSQEIGLVGRENLPPWAVRIVASFDHIQEEREP